MNLNNSLRKTPVAVIGLSAIFADAKNVEEFWTNIIQAKDSITDVPDSRWSIEDYYDADMTAPDKTYCKRGGFIPNVDFNPMEFGLPPNILEVTDASQLLGLVAARDALADAGYGKKSPKFTAALKAKTGVLLGVGGGQKLITPLIARLQYPIWERALRSSGVAEEDIPMIVDKMKKAYVGWNENSFPGLLGNVISGRITNRFDLGGINSVVDAACAASLSAIKMALSELVEGRCDMMLTGGVDTDNSPFMYMSFSKTPAFSKSGNISPFSDEADGMLIGEGLGILVLKRLEDAERDGDKIYAVIKGVGTSSDGRFKSVYAPRSSGQALAMNRAYEEAGYAPATVGLLEAHGTGTGAGDPTEFNSMRMVFEANNPKKQHIALGSVKSQVGHTKAAAGAAGMIKAVLALHHKTLPPTINVAQPNAKFDIENSPIYINTETRPWLRNGAPRRAGVSAFGFGGINVHIAMEEYSAEQQSTYRLHEPYKSILFQAATPKDLLNKCQDSLKKLQAEDAATNFLQLAEASKKVSIAASAARLGFVAHSLEEATSLLQTAIQTLSTKQQAWEHPRGIFYRPNGMTTDGKVVALFSGQGSQYIGMGKEIANAFPQFRQSFQEADELFYKKNEQPLSKTVYPIPVFNSADKKVQQQHLTKTQNAQPAIGTMSMGLYRILKEAGFKPNFTAGHSFGELTALWAAGVYDDATFLALAKARGAAMAATNPNADSGTMLAVKAPFTTVEQEVKSLQGVSIANLNSTNQVVLGGSTTAIKAAEKHFKTKGITAIPLPVSAAFHTEFVQHAQQPFAYFVAEQKFNSPTIPVYSNTTANPYPNAPFAIQSILKGQILKPVLFKNQVENIHQAGGRIFVEFGPKGVLTNLVKDILKGKDFMAVALNPNAKKDGDLQFRQAVIQLQVLGLPLNEVDKYKVPSIIPSKKTKLNVALGGHNYVSPKTQKAYTDVMNNGFQISGGTVTKTIVKEVEKIVEVPVDRIVEVPVEKIVEKIVEVPVTKVVEVPVKNNIHQNIQPEEDMNKEVIQLLQSTLEHFKTQQTKSLEIFERFLSDQNLQSQQLLQMVSQQLDSAQGPQPTPPMPPSNGNGKSNGNSPLRTDFGGHHKIVPMSTEGAKNVLANIASIVSETPVYTSSSPVTNGATNGLSLSETTTETVIVQALKSEKASDAFKTSDASTTSIGKAKLENILLTVISEKTGYPTEMLELDMDMEADLGIDSIKRVEIFGSMTESYPEVSGINPQELTELRTLGQIVDYIAEQSGGSVLQASDALEASDASASTVKTAPTSKVESENSNVVNKAQLENILLTVISEKTGYPTEMLELDMDMEADLGIDSIKRVEIFGSMTESYPEVSGINPQELTELRTLGQIVDYIAEQSGGSALQASDASKASDTSAPTIETAPTSKVEVESSTVANKAQLENILLTVISEKTGYPTEMLELDMDMEADLGIDSIKRVEIFGSMTESYPEVSGINPQELTELRTLGQIVDYIAAQSDGSVLQASDASKASDASSSLSSSSTPTEANKAQLENILLTVISEKTGYPTEMLELDMDMEADLGIDSIKRVEIFGSMTESYPEVSGINPQELTELRTLGQIVDYIATQGKKKVLV